LCCPHYLQMKRIPLIIITPTIKVQILRSLAFTESPSNSLLIIKSPKNQHISSSYSKMPKVAMAKIWPLMSFRGKGLLCIYLHF
jgi:hypothetical protein